MSIGNERKKFFKNLEKKSLPEIILSFWEQEGVQ